mmetsp:Transcript_118335/g.209160  ORF Transcript_118335/g.209160 Transcript_118335/m.209160 type:complete len:164 (+) Transcript_118335:210-701(+)
MTCSTSSGLGEVGSLLVGDELPARMDPPVLFTGEEASLALLSGDAARSRALMDPLTSLVLLAGDVGRRALRDPGLIVLTGVGTSARRDPLVRAGVAGGVFKVKLPACAGVLAVLVVANVGDLGDAATAALFRIIDIDTDIAAIKINSQGPLEGATRKTRSQRA